jgi:dsDNA-binding SOS-regulon protein
MASPDNTPKRRTAPRLAKGFYVFYIVRRNGGTEEVFYTRKEANKYLISSDKSATLERVVRSKLSAKHGESR